MNIDAKTAKRFYAKVSKGENGCWEWQGASANFGYGCFKVAGKLKSSHRVSYLMHVGPLIEGLDVCHKCDNPRCVRPSHLFQGTRQENMVDCYRKGRTVLSWKGKSKLDKFGIEQVCRLVDEFGFTGAAKKLGCTHPTIGDYVRGHGVQTNYINGKRSKTISARQSD